MRDVLASAPKSVRRLRSLDRALAEAALLDRAAGDADFLEPALSILGREAPLDERGFTEARTRGAVCVDLFNFLGRDNELALRVVAIAFPLIRDRQMLIETGEYLPIPPQQLQPRKGFLGLAQRPANDFRFLTR